MNKYRISSSDILELEDDEIFVFGSNLSGNHGAGAALYAVRKFGAINGKGYGIQGKSYGIPTKDRNINTLSLAKIKPHIDKFIKFAIKSDKNFLVTEIGCGLAGYKPKDIAPMFEKAIKISNIYLPQSFINIIENGR